MGESDSSDQGGSFSVADVQCVVSVNGAMDSDYFTHRSVCCSSHVLPPDPVYALFDKDVSLFVQAVV